MNDDSPEYPAGVPQREPTHPGLAWDEILREHLHLPVAEVPRRLPAISPCRPDRQEAVTVELALCFGRLTGADPGLWLQMQLARDRSRDGSRRIAIRRRSTWAAQDGVRQVVPNNAPAAPFRRGERRR